MEDREKLRRQLEEQIAATERQLCQLKQELADLDAQCPAPQPPEATSRDRPTGPWPLLQDEYRRYGRQMIVEQIGLPGQLRLRKSAVLIVGAGGLGCPAALYLAGAGVGRLGIIDGDQVESSNLHRQVLHRTGNTGKYKVNSAIEYLQELNPHPTYTPFQTHLSPQNAPDIFAQFDVILDCTDNPATRYLISDTAVLLGKTVVSASALRTEGQLMILNHPPRSPGDKSGGPCYRCVFPTPPPADSVTSCADGGIIGPVVGVMGVMQALETIRVITSMSEEGKPSTEAIVPSLHLFSAYSTPPFRTIRLRPRRAKCAACGTEPSVSLESLKSGSMDYVQFCGSLNPVSSLMPNERLSARDYKAWLDSHKNDDKDKGILLDARERIQYDICALPGSICVPISDVLRSSRSPEAANGKLPAWLPASIIDSDTATPIHVVCRQGNDSQAAVKILKELGLGQDGNRFIGDIRGGLDSWRRDVDPQFPDY
ncbi:molybdenum cofactor synthesis protein 3 [Nannizzia gypsea CBS 118893]|uniref:Adenylyltransferase and sulfurtransferase uba4 n=1 Tax=Arthroderma gypseum (strain ATCC MYA-4604 / CBS 118893) TaxID=535722 RepID=E4UNH9_ARTGP|nr:molybdenum cofactor synthesis protein 3 [Nannizzia gypsea CBS 118893]EFQ99587.1 molybdenum cofactor synthesis protein 3 [Nannizzia gypsea CBS 118893]